MGVRRGTELDITIACPLLCTHVSGETDYFRRKRRIVSAVERFLAGFPFRKVSVRVNSLDVKGRGDAGVYLSLLGTSAEDADSGQVGRGNRVNGVISLGRPMGTEAAAGKNPVSHVGKIYSVLTHRMASDIHEAIPGLSEVYVWLVSRIGDPVDRPAEVYIRLLPGKKGIDEKAARRKAGRMVEGVLEGIVPLTRELTLGECRIC